MVEECTFREKRAWIIKQFWLKDSPFLHNPNDFNKAVAILMEFWDSFSHDGAYGKTHLLKHHTITEDVPPIKCRYHPVNPALEPDLRKQLDTWLEHGIIEPANSPWSSNLVAAKKNGRVDWRRLNDVTKKVSYPMPMVQDSLSASLVPSIRRGHSTASKSTKETTKKQPSPHPSEASNNKFWGSGSLMGHPPTVGW